jgi:hypothetical protein
MVHRYRSLAIATLGLAFSAPSAFAQAERGVTLDPDSPAAKEYALPIAQARRDTGGDRGATKTSPSFGAGVRPARDKAAGGRSADAGAGGSSREAGSTRLTASQRAEARDGIDRALTTASLNNADSSEGSLVLLLCGGVVIVMGVALGWLLRRRRVS